MVERTHSGASKEGGVHGFPVDSDVKTSIEDGRAGAALKTGLSGVKNELVGNVVPGVAAVVGKTQPSTRLVYALSGDDRINQGRYPHGIADRVEGADRAAAETVELGKGDPIRRIEAAALRWIEPRHPIFGADP